MPSGGDTGSIPSSPLPRADVLLGSGDLGGETVPAVVRALSSLSRSGCTPPSTPLQALPNSKPALSTLYFPVKGQIVKISGVMGQLWSWLCSSLKRITL